MLRILNVEPDRFSEKARKIYQRLGMYEEKTLDREQLIRVIHNYDVLVMRFAHRVDEPLLRKSLKLKIVATNVTGPDHVDNDALSARGIRLICLKDQPALMDGIHASAEHTWALLMALVRKIPSATASVQKAQWDRNLFMGHELNGKTIGILGLGRNGMKVASYARAFGMTIFGYDAYIAINDTTIHLVDSLNNLLKQSDILSIHIPLSNDTYGLINAERFAEMPWGGFLINTSRGGIVDEQALLASLKSGHTAGAALDVIKGEWNKQSRKQNPLIQYAKENDNLIITPHIGGATRESWEKTEIFVAEEVRNYIGKRKMTKNLSPNTVALMSGLDS
jgi:D-3-phosphoglycerate dehydrogenase / 2-oxoglutarate reductase